MKLFMQIRKLSATIRLYAVLIILNFLCSNVNAQMDTLYISSDNPSVGGNLNTAIQDVIDSGTLSNTVFVLEAYGYYVLTEEITVPEGEHLIITAPEPGLTQDTAPPQIVWKDVGGINTEYNFHCYGNITLRNIWLRYADINGFQVGSSIQIEDAPGQNKDVAIFEGVIFDYSRLPGNTGGAVTVTSEHFVGTFKNCYFRNCVDSHYPYFGRALSFPYDTPGWHIDSVLFENCTFANIGFVYAQEFENYGDNVHFNHCTFLNVAIFSLQSGWWFNMFVTNSIFVNTYMMGFQRSPQWGNVPLGGTINIDSVESFGFSVPFTDEERHILFANNSYFLENWLVDWMWENPYSQEMLSQGHEELIPTPQPMLNHRTMTFFDTLFTNPSTGKLEKIYLYMNRKNLYNNSNPMFIEAPTNIESIKEFLLGKWSATIDTNWAYQPELGLNQIWPLPEDLSYSNDTLITAAMGDYPLGDLYHWWPAHYYSWLAQKETEYENIEFMLNNIDSSVITIGVPIPISPVLNAINLPIDTVMLSWLPAQLAGMYECQLSLDPSFSAMMFDTSIADTKYELNSLQYQTKYYWRIRSYNSLDTSKFSIVSSFTTVSKKLFMPTPIYPDNDTVINTSVVELACNRTIDAEQYNWQVSETNTFNHISINDTTTDTTNTVGPLAEGKKYFWRVRGLSSEGASAFTNPYSFSIYALPQIPILISPVDKTDIARLVHFSWQHSTNADEYTIHVDTDTMFSSPEIDTTVSDTSLILIHPLYENTTYHWRAKAMGPGGESSFSERATFTTGTALGMQEFDNFPKAYALSQNYPNPFNPLTHIKYAVPKNGYITIIVYNLLGQQVKVLYEGAQKPGNYKVVLNAEDLASGIYFYRLHAGTIVKTKKLVILK
jgi:hypothetical protein